MKWLKILGHEQGLTRYQEQIRNIQGRCYYISRGPLRLPWFLRPVQVRTDTVCLATKVVIPAGSFAYPCSSDTMRLAPHGDGRLCLEEAEFNFETYLPFGVVAIRMPSFQEMMGMKELGAMRDNLNKSLSSIGTAILNEADRKTIKI